MSALRNGFTDGPVPKGTVQRGVDITLQQFTLTAAQDVCSDSART